MKTPRKKYYNDPAYKALVDVMVSHIEACKFSPSEMREAAMLASIIYEENHVIPNILRTRIYEKALKTIHEFIDKDSR